MTFQYKSRQLLYLLQTGNEGHMDLLQLSIGKSHFNILN